MTREEMLKTVNGIFKDAFEDDAIVITEASSAKDIEDWDSLMQITLIAEVERAFGIKFEYSDAVKMQNVGDMLSIIAAKLAK